MSGEGSSLPMALTPATDGTSGDVREARATLENMLAERKRHLASCERMIELLQPEWDKFEARAGHDTYVARDYADHTSAARTHRKEIAALEAALTPSPALVPDELRELSEKATQGEWSALFFRVSAEDEQVIASTEFMRREAVGEGEEEGRVNAAFIVACVSYVRALLANQASTPVKEGANPNGEGGR
jgi:hypothetical protein